MNTLADTIGTPLVIQGQASSIEWAPWVLLVLLIVLGVFISRLEAKKW